MEAWTLSRDQVAAYERDGFLFPLAFMSTAGIARVRRAVEEVEARRRDVEGMAHYMFNAPHLVIRQVHELVTDARILDRVASVMGPDLLLWNAGFFIKEPHSRDIVSWHQDLTYWGLDNQAAEMSVWIALGDVTAANGAMRFVPGSHRGGLVAHRDTFADANQLSRGQEIAVEVDEDEAVAVELKAGQISLHHGKLFHASGPNATSGRRIGLVFRYITPDMKQVVGDVDYAMLVRGEDRYGHFAPLPEPAFDFAPDKLAAIDAMLRDESVYLYAGAHDRAPSFVAPES